MNILSIRVTVVIVHLSDITLFVLYTRHYAYHHLHDPVRYCAF